jgi:nucleoside-diphosphate-sugar epimerase
MNQRNKSRVFITGASGFVGANVTRELLKNNYDVHVLNRTKNLSWRLKDIAGRMTVHIGDITNISSLQKILLKANPDYIIHLAAYGAYHYQNELEKIVKVNIEGTQNLLEASKNIPYKCFINTGSSSEYGFKNKPMKENDFCEPVSYYALTKLAAGHLCKIFASLNNKPIVTFRLFSVYGPYEEETRFIPAIIKALLDENIIKLTPGNQRRDFIHVDDVSSAYLKALRLGKKIKGETFNIGTGKEYSNDEIVNALFTVTNKKTEIKKGAYPKRLWDTPHWRADMLHTKKVLGWKPKYRLEHGLLETYSWFQKNLHFYN